VLGLASLQPQPSEEVAKEILRYFLRNPHAADSLEGVARWRLLDERIYQNLAKTRRALAWLVLRDYLVEDSSAHTGRMFRLNGKRRAEIARFLTSRGNGEARE
jgi:hypothetical protein